MKISLYIKIIFYLFDQGIHWKLSIVRKANPIYFIILEWRLLTTQQLANEFAGNFIVGIEVTLTVKKIVSS